MALCVLCGLLSKIENRGGQADALILVKFKDISALSQGLERTVTEQKLEIDDLKGQIGAISEKAAQEKDALKRATRAQKQRAERFEAAVEKCYEQLREKVGCLVKWGCLGSEYVSKGFLC